MRTLDFLTDIQDRVTVEGKENNPCRVYKKMIGAYVTVPLDVTIMMIIMMMIAVILMKKKSNLAK